MTLIGKIFIVLIMIMSILFMGFAVSVYSTHTNWKEARDTLQRRVTQQQQENRTLEEQKRQLKNINAFERAARREALANLEQQLQQKAQQYDKAFADLTNLRAQIETAVGNVALAQKQLEDLKGQNRKLRDDIATAQQDRDQQFQEVRRLTNQNHELEGTKVNLERRLNALEQRFTAAIQVLKAYDMTPDTPVTNIPPAVESVVIGVTRDLIKIKVGKDDGIREGHLIEISRGKRYLGRAKVTRVANDEAVAKLVNEIAPIQEGDRVQTKTI